MYVEIACCNLLHDLPNKILKGQINRSYFKGQTTALYNITNVDISKVTDDWPKMYSKGHLDPLYLTVISNCMDTVTNDSTITYHSVTPMLLH